MLQSIDIFRSTQRAVVELDGTELSAITLTRAASDYLPLIIGVRLDDPS